MNLVELAQKIAENTATVEEIQQFRALVKATAKIRNAVDRAKSVDPIQEALEKIAARIAALDEKRQYILDNNALPPKRQYKKDAKTADGAEVAAETAEVAE